MPELTIETRKVIFGNTGEEFSNQTHSEKHKLLIINPEGNEIRSDDLLNTKVFIFDDKITNVEEYNIEIDKDQLNQNILKTDTLAIESIEFNVQEGDTTDKIKLECKKIKETLDRNTLFLKQLCDQIKRKAAFLNKTIRNLHSININLKDASNSLHKNLMMHTLSLEKQLDYTSSLTEYNIAQLKISARKYNTDKHLIKVVYDKIPNLAHHSDPFLLKEEEIELIFYDLFAFRQRLVELHLTFNNTQNIILQRQNIIQDLSLSNAEVPNSLICRIDQLRELVDVEAVFSANLQDATLNKISQSYIRLNKSIHFIHTNLLKIQKEVDQTEMNEYVVSRNIYYKNLNIMNQFIVESSSTHHLILECIRELEKINEYISTKVRNFLVNLNQLRKIIIFYITILGEAERRSLFEVQLNQFVHRLPLYIEMLRAIEKNRQKQFEDLIEEKLSSDKLNSITGDNCPCNLETIYSDSYKELLVNGVGILSKLSCEFESTEPGNENSLQLDRLKELVDDSIQVDNCELFQIISNFFEKNNITSSFKNLDNFNFDQLDIRPSIILKKFSKGDLVLCLPINASFVWGLFHLDCPNYFYHPPDDISDSAEWIMGKIVMIEFFQYADLNAASYYNIQPGSSYQVVSLLIQRYG